MDNVYTVVAEINCNSIEKAMEIVNELREKYYEDTDVNDYKIDMTIIEGY